MRFTPFDKGLEELSTGDLESLREVSEGWYVEYKSQLPTTRDLAKSLSSFANQYGGWLLLGVDEITRERTPKAFPGLDNEMLPEALDSLRNAAKDIVRPQVVFQHRALEGPVETIGLGTNRSVLVVRVPEGSNTPYIHNDGKIYIRVGDSSTPIPVTDKSTFDLLYRRGEDRRSYLKNLIEKTPDLSEAEDNVSYIHLSIFSDPYQTLGHWYQGTYSDFCATMKGGHIPFDNIYAAADGFIARQATTNNRSNRLFTWEFSRNCNSYVTIPIPTLPLYDADEYLLDGLVDIWKSYGIGEDFRARLVSKGLASSRVLNLSILLPLIGMIVSRHRKIVRRANIRGPFYIKARMQNVWRTIPFIDLSEYMDHVQKFDFPVVQSSDMTVPTGTSLDTFVVSPELASIPAESGNITYDGPTIRMWVEIMQALGIPGEFLANNANALASVSNRESNMHRARVSNG